MSDSSHLEPSVSSLGSRELNLTERLVQEFLSANLNLLGLPGLTLIQTEYQVPSGRIDILARDDDGTLFAIELKKGVATRDAVGQLQSYLGDLLSKEASRRIQGILVASGIDHAAMSALIATPTIEFWSYKTLFSFQRVPINRVPPLPPQCPRCGAANALGVMRETGETYCGKCGAFFGSARPRGANAV